MNRQGKDMERPVTSARSAPLLPHGRWRGFAWSTAACLGTTLLASPLHELLDPANIVMLFLLTVVWVAVRLGRDPAVLAAFLSVASFDFFFVPPRFSLTVSDAQYLLTFAVMLTVALVIGQLTARLGLEARTAARREQQTRALYEMARDLSGAFAAEQVVAIAGSFVEENLSARMAAYLPDDAGVLNILAGPAGGSPAIDASLARVAFEQGDPIGPSRAASGPLVLYLPLRAAMRVRGVLAVALADPADELSAEQAGILDTVASLVAIASERLHFVAVAQDALLRVESERLRNTLLSAVSHDLRTPLTALVGLSDALILTGDALPASKRETAEAIRDEALRMNSVVSNLLDMARLQAGVVRLRKEWQPVEEVVGSSLKHMESRLQKHRVRTALQSDLPLLEFDAVLVERVLCNLVDNAVKYAPPDSEVAIEARRCEAGVEISVSDDGPGLAPGSESSIFEKFVRGQPESATSGVGLGLAICRAIVEAHGGSIRAENRPGGGARIAFTLPVGEAPALDAALIARLEGELP